MAMTTTTAAADHPEPFHHDAGAAAGVRWCSCAPGRLGLRERRHTRHAVDARHGEDPPFPGNVAQLRGCLDRRRRSPSPASGPGPWRRPAPRPGPAIAMIREAACSATRRVCWRWCRGFPRMFRPARGYSMTQFPDVIGCGAGAADRAGGLARTRRRSRRPAVRPTRPPERFRLIAHHPVVVREQHTPASVAEAPEDDPRRPDDVGEQHPTRARYRDRVTSYGRV